MNSKPIEEVVESAELQSAFDKLLEEKPEIIEQLTQEARARFPTQPDVWVEIEEVSSLASEVTIKIGSSSAPNEHRLHKHGRFSYRFEARQCKMEVFVRFRHPDLDDFLDDAKTCAGVAAVSGVIAAVAAGNIAAGYAIFYPTWKACMLLKVSSSIVNGCQVELFGKHRCGCWENHC